MDSKRNRSTKAAPRSVYSGPQVQLDLRFTDDDADKLHCLAVLRGGFVGDDATEENGLPTALWRGRPQDWTLALSHSGRYAACAFMVS